MYCRVFSSPTWGEALCAVPAEKALGHVTMSTARRHSQRLGPSETEVCPIQEQPTPRLQGVTSMMK